MNIKKSEIHELRNEQDLVRVRQLVRARALEIKFGIVDQTKIVTAVSEIARNTLIYGGGGQATVQIVDKECKVGLRLIFEDQGPGIRDLALALTDGYTTGHGLGLGLSGAKRLVNEFELQSSPGKGTRIQMVKWK